MLTLPSFLLDSLPFTLPLLTTLFLYSCYSAYEHSSLLTHASTSPSSSPISSSPSSISTSQTPTSTALPPDITLETILSVALICIGLVAGMEELQPIAWRVWAGKVEREGKKMGRPNPWAGLEERVGFVDIRVCCSSRYILLDREGLGKG